MFWVDVGTQESANEGFLAVARSLRCTGGENIVDKARQELGSTRRHWLLVLDNADNVKFDYACYIPSGSHGAIIITSRNRECHCYSTVRPVVLGSLGPEHSRQLLLKAAAVSEEKWQSQERQAQDIVNDLGAHTLALIQAGAYVAKQRCQLHEFRAKFLQQRERIFTTAQTTQNSPQYGNVYATFEVSAKLLERRNDEAGRDALDLLAILSMVHHGVLPLRLFECTWIGARRVLQNIPSKNDDMDEQDDIDVFGQWHVHQLPEFIDPKTAAWDNDRLKNAIDQLVSLSLISLVGTDAARLWIHPLVNAWAHDRLPADKQRQARLSTGCVISLSRNIQDKGQDCWKVLDTELRAHLESFLSPPGSVQQHLWTGRPNAMLVILVTCGWILHDYNQDKDLEKLLRDIYEGLRLSRSTPSIKHIRLWQLAGRNLFRLRYLTEAVELLKWIVEIEGTLLDKTHSDRMSSKQFLAMAYDYNGQKQDALNLLESAIETESTMLLQTCPDLLEVEDDMSVDSSDKRPRQKAESLFINAVNIMRENPDRIDYDRLEFQRGLAGLYLRMSMRRPYYFW